MTAGVTIEEALLDAFTEGELREMLRARLDVELEHITAADLPLRERVWELVAWARRQQRLGELVQAIVAERPGLGLSVQVRQPAGFVEAGHRGRGVDFESGWQQRIEGKIDRLGDALGKLDVRLTVLEDQVARRSEGFTPSTWWVAMLLLAALVTLGTVVALRLP